MPGNVSPYGKPNVTCVGGGPGSDTIGVLKYLDEHKKQEGIDKITCYLLDKEQAKLMQNHPYFPDPPRYDIPIDMAMAMYPTWSAAK